VQKQFILATQKPTIFPSCSRYLSPSYTKNVTLFFKTEQGKKNAYKQKHTRLFFSFVNFT